jgi:hypothetical protein
MTFLQQPCQINLPKKMPNFQIVKLPSLRGKYSLMGHKMPIFGKILHTYGGRMGEMM